jgi:hypothetical protein
LQSAKAALEALNHLGADIPNLKSLEERAVEILNKKPEIQLQAKVWITVLDNGRRIRPTYEGHAPSCPNNFSSEMASQHQLLDD